MISGRRAEDCVRFWLSGIAWVVLDLSVPALPSHAPPPTVPLVFPSRSLTTTIVLRLSPAEQATVDGGLRSDRENSKDDSVRLSAFENLIRQNKFGEVEPILRDYLHEYPQSWRAEYQLGYVLFQTHKFGPSIEALASSLQLNLNNAEAHKILGLNLVIIGKYDQALLELEQAARLKPDSAEIRYHLGRIYYTRNVFPLAKREFEAAINLAPDYMKAFDNLGLTMEAMGDDGSALGSYNKAIELNERQGLHSPWPYINLASFYNRKNDPRRALDLARRGLEQDREANQAFVQIAKAYRNLGQWGQAAEALQKAIEIDPGHAETYYILSQVYRKLGRLKESQQAMNNYQQLQSSKDNFLLEQAIGRNLHQPVPMTGADEDKSP
jgi:tetratricopeptide (TPR) repeat protein